jgi:ferric-dicitrate binding protein FerR (iron transport regulator)
MNYLSIFRLICMACAVPLMGGMASCTGSESRTAGADSGSHRNIRTDTVDITEIDSTHDVDLFPSTDGSTIYLTTRTKLRPVKGDHSNDRTYELDGEAWFTVRDADKKPVVIRTRQLIITLQSPIARLHIDAFASSPGEQADLLEGQLKVTKAYHSTTDNEPETLRSGDMVMINKEIDLMEKETLNPAERKKVEMGFPKPSGTAPHN